MLKTAGFNLPRKVHIHGFLTVNGEKMSKSKGTFVRASTYLDHLDPAYLRYYYASKLTARVDDIDMNLDELVARVNSDLVGNVVNLASRTAKFIQEKPLAGAYPDDGGLFEQAAKDGEAIAEAYEACDFNRAMRQVMAVADRANQYIEHNAPWKLAKDPAQADRLRDVCTVGLNLFRQVAIYLAPVLPKLAEQTGRLLGQPIERWDESQQPVLGNQVSRFEHMMKRLRREQVDAMIAASAEPEKPQAEAEQATAVGAATPDRTLDSDKPLQDEPLAEEITIDDFAKVDLRVARVLAAEDVAQAKKLLKLTLSLGGEHTRTVFAGIKGVYEPEQLVGRLVVCVANLAPRKMKFGTSEGMVVAAGAGGKEIFLLASDEGAQPGHRVH
jgi:methionyl-tRNA synthetase